MDALQHLASSDSFSYRWFLNIKPAFDINSPPDEDVSSSSYYARSSSLGHSSYIDMDPNLLQLRRPSDASAPDSNFNFPAAHSLTTLLHADQLFSNGHIMPLQLLSPPKFQTPPPPSAHLSSNLPPSEFSKNLLSLSNTQPQFIQKCRRWSSKRILHKYLGFLRPLYRRVCGKRPLVPPMVNCVESLQATPRTSITISASEWCHNNLLFESDIENLIYEAVLHCKKSTGETL